MADGEPLTFEIKTPNLGGVSFVKTYTFTPGEYDVKVTNTAINESNEPIELKQVNRLMLAQSGPQKEDFNLVVDPDQAKPGWFVFTTFTGPSVYTNDRPYTQIKLKDAERKPFISKVKGQSWVAIQQRYFLGAWLSAENDDRVVTTAYKSNIEEEKRWKFFELESKAAKAQKLEKGERLNVHTTFYAGPEVASKLASLNKSLALTVDYGTLWYLSDALFRVMSFINGYLDSWGWSIIITTLLIKLVFYKLSEKGYKTAAFQKKLAPRMAEINETYKDNPEKKMQAIKELNQKEGIKPFKGGCLPSLIKLPFFLALYFVLGESVSLRLAPFLWMSDLSAPDPLYILPLLMALSSFLMQKFTPTPQANESAAAKSIIPLMMGFIFAQLPAGVVMYQLVNQTLDLLQQYMVFKKYDAL